MEKLNSFLREEINKAKAIGIELQNISPDILLIKGSSRYGTCGYKKINGVYDKSQKVISLNQTFVENAPDLEIRATIMHEVLHATIGAKGHDSIWKSSVEKVLASYSYDGYEDYHLCPTPYSRQNRQGKHTSLSREKEAKYILECPKCKSTWKYSRMTKAVKRPHDYSCGICHTNLRRIL